MSDKNKTYRRGDKSEYTHPYLRAINLSQYVWETGQRKAAGFYDGKYHLNGLSFTPEEFNRTYPAVLSTSVIQLDGTQIEHD